MLSLHNIRTVARYEIKTLLRSWFFRIFSVGTIIILTFVNIPFFSWISDTPWLFRGIASSIPYMNLLLLNVAQAVIAVFLASDFLKRDKKLDTTEVVYMRSMTNGDYVLGKFLGILLVFVGLNIIVLLIAMIFNVFLSDVPFVAAGYLFYPLFISIPTLVFIFGLSFLFMVIVRNQAVTFIILLGYIAITLFFLAQKFHYLFDYMAFSVPLMYSDFVGFGNFDTLLIHRGLYFLLGMGFIFATILMIKRLPQSRTMTRISAVLSAVLILTALGLGYSYLSRQSAAKQLRQQMLALNQQTVKLPAVTPLQWKLDLKHEGKTIAVTAKLIFKNNSDRPMDRYIFSLNPGLTVQQVVAADAAKLRFERELINEQACYLDIDEQTREQSYRIWAYNIAKRFSFIEPDYVLLTPEVVWYPVAGVPYGAAYPQLSRKNFTRFRLRVQTKPGLIAVSQGSRRRIEPGEFLFTPEQPLPQLCLAIGNYEKHSVRVDSIDYQLFHLKGHDYFLPYFDAINDTLPALIRDAKQDFENKLELTYRYPTFSLIEVPIQFFSYKRLWTSHQESVQPEMVLLPENGVLIDAADFKRQKKWQDRRRQRSNQTLMPQEIQSSLFNQFVRSALTGTRYKRFIEDLVKAPVNYNIFPNYYTFVNHFHSEQLPIFNIALESYLYDKSAGESPPFARFFTGITDEEKANLALAEQNLAEIIADPNQKDILSNVIRLKGTYLFKLLRSKLDPEAFQTFLTEILARYRFRSADVAQFIAELKQRYGFDLEPFINTWYQDRRLPAFIVANIDAYKVLDNDRTRYQVKFKVTNQDSVDGLLSLTFRTGRRRFFGMGSPEMPEERLISLKGGQTKEIGIVLDDQPRLMMINTLISRNLPSVIDRRLDELELHEKAIPFDGERIVDQPIQLIQPGEIVVDNEDPGFEILFRPRTSSIKRLLQSRHQDEEQYIRLNFWRPPRRWRATTSNQFYGKYIHSAYYIKAGNGDKKVAWNAEIPQSGNYDIYYYTAKIRVPWYRRGRRGRESQFAEQFHFLIHHDDGISEEILDVSQSEEGWNFLGTYYISAGSTRVELTDESKSRIVFADAVKWVKH